MTNPVEGPRPPQVYDRLLAAYGPQGWWPLAELRRRNPRGRGYHPGDYSLPDTPEGRFEVGVGAILTQNTTWTQVEVCLDALAAADLLDPAALAACPGPQLQDLVRPSGYFRRKARKLVVFATAFPALDAASPDRRDLLDLWGVGEETADSILLYAYGRPGFVADAYARRLAERLSGVPPGNYRDLQRAWSVPFTGLDPRGRARIFNEFHALVVAHAKARCRSRPRCGGCPLKSVCRYGGRG